MGKKVERVTFTLMMYTNSQNKHKGVDQASIAMRYRTERVTKD